MIGAFCSLACAFMLHISPATTPQANPNFEPVYWGSQQVGVYVDDTDPTQCSDVAQARALGWPLVISGRYEQPAYASPYCPAASYNAVEWYPWINGRELWGAPPPAEAYILPWHFAWLGPPPTDAQRALELRQAERNHPRLVLWYYAN